MENDTLPAPGELPPLIESIDRDIYGLPATRKVWEKLPRARKVSPADIALPPEVADDVKEAEAALWAEVSRARLPQAKRDSTREVVAANRQVAAREGNWPAYLTWLAGKADELAAKAGRS